MNKSRFAILLLCAALVNAGPALAQHQSTGKTSGAEEFFLISSVDKEKSELLLKRPTEVTVLMKITERTKYEDEAGKALKLSDFRAGDTVWISYSRAANSDWSISRIRKGPMTVELLRRLYLRSSS